MIGRCYLYSKNIWKQTVKSNGGRMVTQNPRRYVKPGQKFICSVIVVNIVYFRYSLTLIEPRNARRYV